MTCQAVLRTVREAVAPDDFDDALDGLAPREANWAAWQTTPTAMMFHFQNHQLRP